MKSERLGMDFDADIRHVGLVRGAFGDDGGRLSDQWELVVDAVAFPYFTGLGHRKPRALGREDRRECEALLRSAKPDPKDIRVYTKEVTPKLDDILYCLVADASAVRMTFADWCSDFGYSDDSIKALETYNASVSNGRRVEKILLAKGVTLEKAQEAFQDY